MAGTLLGGVLDEEIGEGVAVAGEEPDSSEETLLEMAVGVEAEQDGGGVLFERGFSLKLEGSGHATKAVHLVAHLAGGDGGGAAEVGAHGGHVFGGGR